MKAKILNALLLITPLIGYLEWGGNNHIFIAQAEADVMVHFFTDPLSAVHPFTLIPFAGQVLLLITLFQKQPSKKLTYIAIACLALLLGFMFIIGATSGNFKIVASTLPFWVTAVVTVRHHRIPQDD